MKNDAGDGTWGVFAKEAALIGNEFRLPRAPRLQVSNAPATLPLGESGVLAMPAIPVHAAATHEEVIPVILPAKQLFLPESPAAPFSRPHLPSWTSPLTLISRYKLATFALLLLVLGVGIIRIGGSYLESRVANPSLVVPASLLYKHNVAGLSLTVPANELQQKLNAITNQPANLSVGSQTVPIGASTIKSWLKISASADKTEDYIYLNQTAMTSSLKSLASQFTQAPVNQVSVTHNGVSQVVVAGVNGYTLSDPSTLTTQVHDQAKTVMNGNGLNFSTPLSSQPFQALTPANFDKLLEANLTTKELYVWQNGQIINTFASSDGKPSTPTPVGEFHIWVKLNSQTMTGPGYVQPNVPYVNYFDHSGDAVHGVYWRPASVFGNINTSHGCIGIPVSEAAWVYNWAPIGTTVITHY